MNYYKKKKLRRYHFELVHIQFKNSVNSFRKHKLLYFVLIAHHKQSG